MNAMVTEFILIPLAWIVLGGFVLLVAKMFNDWCTPYELDIELAENDNPALALSFAGYLIATCVIFISAMLGPTNGLGPDLVATGGYALLGILLLNASRWINDRVILHRFSNVKEIIEDRNLGCGAVQFGSYLAAGLMVGGAIQGTGGGIHTALAFFILGQAVLIVFALFYDKITPFCLHKEIERNNNAAGIAFAGALTANGIILLQACGGDFISWEFNLGKFGAEALSLLILLPLVRFCFDRILFAKVNLNKEIAIDQNCAAGLLEAAGFIAFALIFTAALS